MNHTEQNTMDNFNEMFSSFLSPLENKKIISILNTFMMSFIEKSSTFIGKKMNLEFNEIELNNMQDFLDKNDVIYTDFLIKKNHCEKGFLVIEKKLINLLINLIFGNENPDEPENDIMLGKCGHKITINLLSMLLESLKTAIHEDHRFEPQIIGTHDNKHIIMTEARSEKFYQLSFKITCTNKNALLFTYLPEKFIEAITSENHTHEVRGVQDHTEYNKDQLKKELIESFMPVRVLLPKISLKFKDVLNLKAGDTIPLSDLGSVELFVGDKKAYQGTVGQANNFRVVKIINSRSPS